MALLNRGSNPSRVCFLLENVESMADHNGDCRSKQGRDPHSAAKEKERIRSVLQKLLQKPEGKKLGKVSVSNIALHCFDFSLTTGR